jgi:hypothetical protein
MVTAWVVMRFAITLEDSNIHYTPEVVGKEGRVRAVDITGITAVLSLLCGSSPWLATRALTLWARRTPTPTAWPRARASPAPQWP